MSGSESTGKIFNVPEPTSADATTAASAQIEAKTSQESRQIEKNAEETKSVAAQAATAAASLGEGLTGDPSVAEQLSKKTEAAVAEGQRDVASSTYLGQAKDLAGSAVSTAQSYLPPSLGGNNPK